MPVFLALALLLAGAASTSAQAVAPSSQVVPPARPLPAFEQLQAWIQLSKTHRVGEIDAAVRTIASWPAAHIQVIDGDLLALQLLLEDRKAVDATARTAGRTLAMKDLGPLFDLADNLFLSQGRPMDSREIRKPDSAPRQAIARILIRAAMLHTDFLTAAARNEMVNARPSGGAPAGATIRVTDAEQNAVADFGIYWSCARTAMDLAGPTPVGAALVHDWYVSTSEYLLTQRDYAAGVPHMEHARHVEPGDPRLALYLGAAYETLASPAIQAAFQDGESALTIGSRPDLLRKAEFQFRSALLLDADVADARLRLGRTLLLMARADEALPFFARAEAALPRPESKYYAALFTGLAHAERGNTVDARAAFARASAAFPEAQSPRLAVAQLLMLPSNRDEALQTIKALTARDEKSDPWWNYDIDLAWNVSERLTSLRTAINDRIR